MNHSFIFIVLFVWLSRKTKNESCALNGNIRPSSKRGKPQVIEVWEVKTVPPQTVSPRHPPRSIWEMESVNHNLRESISPAINTEHSRHSPRSIPRHSPGIRHGVCGKRRGKISCDAEPGFSQVALAQSEVVAALRRGLRGRKMRETRPAACGGLTRRFPKYGR